MSDLVKKTRLLTGYMEARILRKYGYGTANKNQSNNISTNLKQSNNISTNVNQSNNISANEDQSNSNGNIDQSEGVHVEILTPSDPDQRGAQLSLSFSINITQVFYELEKRGVVVSPTHLADMESY